MWFRCRTILKSHLFLFTTPLGFVGIINISWQSILLHLWSVSTELITISNEAITWALWYSTVRGSSTYCREKGQRVIVKAFHDTIGARLAKNREGYFSKVLFSQVNISEHGGHDSPDIFLIMASENYLDFFPFQLPQKKIFLGFTSIQN